jgi:hypothetical protein
MRIACVAADRPHNKRAAVALRVELVIRGQRGRHRRGRPGPVQTQLGEQPLGRRAAVRASEDSPELVKRMPALSSSAPMLSSVYERRRRVLCLVHPVLSYIGLPWPTELAASAESCRSSSGPSLH